MTGPRLSDSTTGVSISEVPGSQAGPLKPRIDAAVRNIQVQVSKLQNTTNKLKERDGAEQNRKDKFPDMPSMGGEAGQSDSQ